MAIKQLSVFVANQPGTLRSAVDAISAAGVNIRALSLADTKDFGILRLIVSDPQKAVDVLGQQSLVTVTDVLAVSMDDRAGALSSVLQALAAASINIEYMYAFTAPTPNGAYVVFRVDDNAVAEAALQAAGVTTLTDADIAAI